jgi:Family of unknown function (DUF6065)
MKLECYALAPEPPLLVPAQPLRDWMDAFPDRHAYRCLPLSIANTHGWELLSPCSFEIRWNGGPAAGDVTIHARDAYPWLRHFAMSNFTHGIVTFHTGYIFRTEPGWNMLASGPFNRPKDGVAPLTGVIETDWLPYPFTMNWQLTRPGSIHWDKDEPFCMVFPVQQGALEQTQPVILDVEQNHGLKAEYEAWRDRRNDFMAKFNAGDAQTLKQAWQRYYFLGKMASTGETVPTHSSKIRLDAPLDMRHGSPAAESAASASSRPAATQFAAQPLSQLAMQEAARAEPLAGEIPAAVPKSKQRGARKVTK